MTMRLPIEPPRTALSNAVIVATKADAILEEDRGRLAGLLEEMLESDFMTLPSRISFRVCASYDATQRETDGRRWVIIGRVPREARSPPTLCGGPCARQLAGLCMGWKRI